MRSGPTRSSLTAIRGHVKKDEAKAIGNEAIIFRNISHHCKAAGQEEKYERMEKNMKSAAIVFCALALVPAGAALNTSGSPSLSVDIIPWSVRVSRVESMIAAGCRKELFGKLKSGCGESTMLVP